MLGQFSTRKIAKPTYQAVTNALQGQSLGPARQDKIFIEPTSFKSNILRLGTLKQSTGIPDWAYRKPVTTDNNKTNSSFTSNSTDHLEGRASTQGPVKNQHPTIPKPSQTQMLKQLEQYINRQKEEIIKAIRTLQGQNDMAPVVVKTFYGAKDGSKNPSEYLEDMEFVVECLSSQVLPNAIERLSRITFWNNLQGAALEWYMDFPDQVKGNWETLQTHFTTAYRITDMDRQVQKKPILQEVQSILQGQNKPLEVYIQRVNSLAPQVPELLDTLLANNFVQGPYNANHRCQVGYELSIVKIYGYQQAVQFARAV